MTAARRLWLLPMLGVLACATVLGIQPRAAQPFEHRAHLLQGVSCVSCHVDMAGTERNDALNLPGTASCVGCHAEPHTAQSCSDCHGNANNRFAAEQAKRHLRFDHTKHAEVARGQCVRCHQAVATGDGPLRPTMATCLSCHEHRDEWPTRQCGACHVDMKGEHVRPESHVVHGPDFMATHGVKAASSRDLCTSCHVQSECAQCHGATVPALPNVLHFEDPNRPDMHRAGFAARHSLEARADPALCTTCHSESSCQDCHAKKGLLRVSADHANPHPPDWVGPPGSGNRHGREAQQNPLGCASCHSGGREQLCVGCHREGAVGGSPHPPGFDSPKSQGEMPCRMCHRGAP